MYIRVFVFKSKKSQPKTHTRDHIQDEHSCISFALQSLKNINKENGFQCVVLGHTVCVKVWIHCFIGDTKGNNKWLGQYPGNREGVRRQCCACKCLFNNLSTFPMRGGVDNHIYYNTLLSELESLKSQEPRLLSAQPPPHPEYYLQHLGLPSTSLRRQFHLNQPLLGSMAPGIEYIDILLVPPDEGICGLKLNLAHHNLILITCKH